jgi:hypothetical protein
VSGLAQELREALRDAGPIYSTDQIERLIVLAGELERTARNVVYPFDFNPRLPVADWEGSELKRALDALPHPKV